MRRSSFATGISRRRITWNRGVTPGPATERWLPVQPLIAPLFGGLTEIELLARIAGEEVTSPYEIVRETFAGHCRRAVRFRRGLAQVSLQRVS